MISRMRLFPGLLACVTLTFSGCGSDGAGSPEVGLESVEDGPVFILGSDFKSSSSIYSLDLKTGSIENRGCSLSGSDSVAFLHNRLVYLINRTGAESNSNINIIDPIDCSLALEESLGGVGSNPQEIVFASDEKAYVTRYCESDYSGVGCEDFDNALYIVDPRPDSWRELGRIDLGRYKDSDGSVEMSQMIIANGKLYVAIANLDRKNGWKPIWNSRLVVIDIETDTIIGVVDIGYSNALGRFSRPDEGSIAIGALGLYGKLDGGIVSIDTRSDSVISRISERDLGADILEARLVSDSYGFALLTDDKWNTILKRFDLATSPEGAPIAQASAVKVGVGYRYRDLMWTRDGKILLAEGKDRGSDPGIWIYDFDESGGMTPDSERFAPIPGSLSAPVSFIERR